MWSTLAASSASLRARTGRLSKRGCSWVSLTGFSRRVILRSRSNTIEHDPGGYHALFVFPVAALDPDLSHFRIFQVDVDVDYHELEAALGVIDEEGADAEEDVFDFEDMAQSLENAKEDGGCAPRPHATGSGWEGGRVTSGSAEVLL